MTPGLGNRHYKSGQYEQAVWYTSGVIDQRMRACNIHLQTIFIEIRKRVWEDSMKGEQNCVKVNEYR
jgi:hypothetical protein